MLQCNAWQQDWMTERGGRVDSANEAAEALKAGRQHSDCP